MLAWTFQTTSSALTGFPLHKNRHTVRIPVNPDFVQSLIFFLTLSAVIGRALSRRSFRLITFLQFISSLVYPYNNFSGPYGIFQHSPQLMATSISAACVIPHNDCLLILTVFPLPNRRYLWSFHYSPYVTTAHFAPQRTVRIFRTSELPAFYEKWVFTTHINPSTSYKKHTCDIASQGRRIQIAKLRRTLLGTFRSCVCCSNAPSFNYRQTTPTSLHPSYANTDRERSRTKKKEPIGKKSG